MKTNALKNGIAALLLGISLYSCTSENKEVNEDKITVNKEEEYLFEIREKDSVIKEIFASMDEIQTEIDEVKLQEKLQTMGVTDDELSVSQKEKIKQDIRMMRSLLAENREQIDQMKKLVGRYKGKEKEFGATIAELEAQMKNREESIAASQQLIAQLEAKIQRLSASVDSLKAETAHRDVVIASKDESLQTAYYVTGTKKELKESGVIEPSGGVLGIGRTMTINPSLGAENLTKVDIYEVKSIPVNTRNAKLLSTHPSSSYQFRKNGKDITSIEILDADAFWKNSKYLVVQVY